MNAYWDDENTSLKVYRSASTNNLSQVKTTLHFMRGPIPISQEVNLSHLSFSSSSNLKSTCLLQLEHTTVCNLHRLLTNQSGIYLKGFVWIHASQSTNTSCELNHPGSDSSLCHEKTVIINNSPWFTIHCAVCSLKGVWEGDTRGGYSPI